MTRDKDLIFFLRWQFDDYGRMRHSLHGAIDFEQHLRTTNAQDDPHRECCACPKCRPESYAKLVK